MSNKSGASEQIISLPQGGGALQGIGEKFSPDLFTGTGNFTVPIALPPGRNGFQPQLNLVYSTGNGNGLFGLGWNLSIPGVSRKTSHGVPRYRDYDPDVTERDTLILSGAEDLVPISDAGPGITQYRPRTEGLFARIEHHKEASHNYWEVRSKDGLTSIYGDDPTEPQNYASGWVPPAISSVLAKPADPSRIYAWKLSLTKDPFGNRIEYFYKRSITDKDEESKGHNSDQPLLTQIRYGDFFEPGGQLRFLITVSFDYEDRPDRFSEYRAGFEIRTVERCKTIRIETHFETTLAVREYRFTYDNQTSLNGFSLLKAVDVIGFDDAGIEVQELPPLTFDYTKFQPQDRKFETVGGTDLPSFSLSNPSLELVDLTGDGLPDILEMNGTVRYWRNLGNGSYDLPRPMRDAPPTALADPGVQMIDANGDGRADLLVTNSEVAGYYPLDFDGRWNRGSFQSYSYSPSFNFEDPEVKLVDLDGDGLTDVIRSGTRLECYFNDADRRKAWTRTARVERKNSDLFPIVNFSDPRVKWGDMTGDNLQDIVLVYDGNIEYWPNLGHGQWGKRIHMENSPCFRDSGYSVGYDPRRILIGDVDGDGLADIVYVDNGKVVLWINQSGNAWSDPIEICGTPPVTDMDAVRLVDLLGNGIGGVLWSADASVNGQPHMHFLDFTGSIKPYLLNEMDNHLGATTKVEYHPSTWFYLEDQKQRKTRWRTTLPFPVQVVARVEVIDAFSKGKLTTVYRYHHGYWDGAEREFRGFGMVEQLDTETFEIYSSRGLHGATAFGEVPARHFSPPTLTRTWFHQGPVEDASGQWYEPDRSQEYWTGDPLLLNHTESVNTFLGTLPDRPSRRDALRTLRGSILRTELYALDRFANQDRIGPEDRPYTVTEQAYSLREEDLPSEAKPGRKRIFFPHGIAQRTTQWERGDDPMTSFSFTGDYDAFGQPRQNTTVAMPRRSVKRLQFAAAVVGTVQVNETHVLATHSRSRYAEPDPSLYIHDHVFEIHMYELNTLPEVVEEDEQGNDISADVIKILQAQYHAAQAINRGFEQLQGAKLISHVLNHYDGPAFEGRRDGKVGPYGALTRSETLVFRAEELNKAFSNRRPAYLGGSANLPAGAPQGFGSDLGYHRENRAPYVTGYYADTQRRRYDFQETNANIPHGLGAWPQQGIATAMQESRRNTTTILPDRYWLLPELVRDAAGLETSATYNYRVMQPEVVTEVNGNRTNFRFNAQGLLKKQWLVSRDGQQGGTETEPDVEFVYDFLAYDRTRDNVQPQPIYAHVKQRLWHASDNLGDERIEAREYSDGFGRLLQKRAQAEELVLGESGDDVGLPGEAGTTPRPVVGQRGGDRKIISGWQVYDNKGKVAEKYEPFFSSGWDYEAQASESLKHVELYYDPRGQVIRTLNLDGSEQRVILGIPYDLTTPQDFAPTPWETYSYDANDLASITNASNGSPLASRVPTNHHFTPSSALLNAQGKVIAQISRNGSNATEWHLTRSRYDVRGNLIEIIDAMGRLAFQHAYDLHNRQLMVNSIDAGLRTSVLDAQGSLVEYRDSKGSVVLRRYDMLNRSIEVWAVNDFNAPEQFTQRERIVYGDQANLPNAQSRNLLGKPFQHYDEAGMMTFDRYDYKGNLLEKMRRVVRDSAIAAGWTAHWEDGTQALRELEPPRQAYQTSTRFDALNRPIQITYPRDSLGNRAVLTPMYNHAGSLRAVRLGNDEYVREIAYNAKGQRVLIAYGNNVMTRYAYDPETFRLLRLRTERFTTPAQDSWQGRGAPLQDYTYTYDLAGNILSIEERVPGCGIAQPAHSSVQILDRNRLLREFEYDPIYRLVSANGRACKSTTPRPFEDLPVCGSSPPNFNQTNAPGLTEPYSEIYRYDPAGNMLELIYQSGTGNQRNNWTRTFAMGGAAPADWRQAPNNRLTRLEVGQNPLNAHTYIFDDNGNLQQQDTNQIHTWDHADRMIGYRRQPQGGRTASVEARYLYGADGIRVKKWVRTNGRNNGESRVYVDGIFEHQNWRKNGQSGQTDYIHVMDNQNRVALSRPTPAHPDDQGPNVQYDLGDHLNSSGVVLGGGNAQANDFINREEFYPFGETSFGSFGKKRYRYTGKERDNESGLCYHGARYYLLWLVRWNSPDPLGIVDGINLYIYVDNQPLQFVDNHGLSKDEKAPPTICYETDQTDPDLGPMSLHIHPNDTNVIHMSESTAQENGGIGRGTLEDQKSLSQQTESSVSKPDTKTPAAMTAVGAGLTLAGLGLSQAGTQTNMTTILWAGRRSLEAALEFAQKSSTAFRALETSTLGKISRTISTPILKIFGREGGAATALYHALWKPVSAIFGFHAGAMGHKALRAIQTTKTTPYGRILSKIEGPAFRLGARSIGLLKSVGKWLPVAGGALSAAGLANDITNGDWASAIGNSAGTVSAVAATVGATSTAAVTGAFALGYGIGTIANDLFLQEQIDKLQIGSGAVGDWYYRTFLK
jgi:RHS repeat-associated protein